MIDISLIIKKLDRIENLLEGYVREILNVEQLSEYTGFKKSQIYKLVHNNLIPYSKPNGKYLFFEKSEIDIWLLQNKKKSISQIHDEALKYMRQK